MRTDLNTFFLRNLQVILLGLLFSFGIATCTRSATAVITTEVSRVQYAGDDGTTGFSVPFYFIDDDDVVVVKTSEAGVETILTKATHYSVIGAGNQSGGQVVMVTAPADGELLTIYRDVAPTQPFDYEEGSAFPAESHEQALDRVTMVAQQALRKNANAIRLSEATAASAGSLELQGADVPSTLMGFNSNGDLEVMSYASVKAAIELEDAEFPYGVGITDPPVFVGQIGVVTGQTLTFDPESPSGTVPAQTLYVGTESGWDEYQPAEDSLYGQMLKDGSVPVDKLETDITESVFSPGDIKATAAVVPQAGWIFCYGQTVNRPYPYTEPEYSPENEALFNAITFTKTVTTANGSPIVTGIDSTEGMRVGMDVEVNASGGTAIPVTTIVSIDSATQITLDDNATSTGSVVIRFFPYGNGNGTNSFPPVFGAGTFNMPDLRGRAIYGRDDMGGTAANRITSAAAHGVDGTALGDAGGVEEHALTEAEMPEHNHELLFSDVGGTGSSTITDSDKILANDDATPVTSSTQMNNAGDGDAHTNLPPMIVLNYIIKQ